MTGFNPTPQQRKNLTKLADYLAALPPAYDQFRMNDYYALEDEDGDHDAVDLSETAAELNECGACACAIGHGPLAGIRPKKGEWSWAQYSKRAFGCTYAYYTKSDEPGAYMFGPENPDDPHAAAERIREVLDGRKVFA